jgi:hypothetical protein
MPEEIREHVRDCAGCRAFIREWNSIEAGLQSLRSQTPALPADFHDRLDDRLRGVRPVSPAVRCLPALRFAAAGALATAALAALALYAGSTRGPAGAPPDALASGRAASPQQPANTLPHLPLANTGR